jgi:hypothetical protein
VANSGLYDVRWYDETGTLVVRMQRSDVSEGPELTRRQRAQVEKYLDDMPRITRAPAPFGMPDKQAPLASLQFDDAGRLWVERAVRPGEDRLADVYRRDGVLVAQVEWPWRVAAIVLRPDLMIGAARGDLDVPQVVRLRLQPPARGRSSSTRLMRQTHRL